jgi:4-amino-4-deoxy-L-arabinose transferase-like glycosyltransferase
MNRRLKLSNPYFITTLLVAIAFFVSTAYFNFSTQHQDLVKWNSPDETANYFFSHRLASEGVLAQFEEANVLASDLVMPRSMRSDGGWLKPVSFLGLILLYGYLGAWISPVIIPYLTPFFGALGIIFFFLFLRRLFSERIAAVSAALLAVFPVYFYYSLRSMFHNVLFLVMLIIGAYFLAAALNRRFKPIKQNFFKDCPRALTIKGSLLVIFSGFFFGWAIAVRTSEIIWLLPLLGLVALFYWRRLGFSRILLFLVGLFFALLPTLYYNQLLYNSPFYGGYNEMNRSLETISAAGSDFVFQSTESFKSAFYSLATTVKETVFYFGFKPRQSLDMFNYYVVEMFPWLTVFTPLGFLILLLLNLRKPAKKYLVYLLSWILLSLVLVLYYGSWRFTDNPNAASHTIGNSYTRYWLPIYLMALPLVALTWELIARGVFYFWRRHRAYRYLVSGFVALIYLIVAFQSFNFLIFSG